MGHDGKKQCRWCFGVLLHTREQSTLRQLEYPPTPSRGNSNSVDRMYLEPVSQNALMQHPEGTGIAPDG